MTLRLSLFNVQVFNRLSPTIIIYILLSVLHIFLMVLVARIYLIKRQEMLSLVIISFILVSCMFDQVAIL